MLKIAGEFLEDVINITRWLMWFIVIFQFEAACLLSPPFIFQNDIFLRHYDKGPCRNKLGHSRASVMWNRTQVTLRECEINQTCDDMLKEPTSFPILFPIYLCQPAKFWEYWDGTRRKTIHAQGLFEDKWRVRRTRQPSNWQWPAGWMQMFFPLESTF